MSLCKFHHMEAGRLGRDGFQTFIKLIRESPTLKEETRRTAVKWLPRPGGADPDAEPDSYQESIFAETDLPKR